MSAKPHQPDPFPVHRRRSGAIDFYVSVFGAKLVDRMDGPGGTVAHAELDFGNGRLQLGDPAEAYQIAAVDPKAPTTHSIAFYCEDVDAVVAGAEQAGATIREPAQTFVTGDRFVDRRPVRPADRDDPCRDAPPRNATAAWPNGRRIASMTR